MVRSKARLVVLLTDCCNVRSDGQRHVAPAPQNGLQPWAVYAAAVMPVAKWLAIVFFRIANGC